jgi:hypothetical protein
MGIATVFVEARGPRREARTERAGVSVRRVVDDKPEATDNRGERPYDVRRVIAGRRRSIRR